MRIKLSEFKKLVKEEVESYFNDFKDHKSEEGRQRVEGLFANSPQCVSLRDIEEIAYELEHDAADAERLYVDLVEFAHTVAEKQGMSLSHEVDSGDAVQSDVGFVKNASPQAPAAPTPPPSTPPQISEEKLAALKKVIKEEIANIKKESEKCSDESFKSLLRFVKEINKSLSLKKNSNTGNFTVLGCSPSEIEIRPLYDGVHDGYELMMMLNGTDRIRKMNFCLKDVKDELKKVLKSDDLSYVSKSFDKAADQVKDETDKTKLEDTSIKPKELSDKKNKEKDYTEKEVKDEKDNPDKPMAEVSKIVRQEDQDSKNPKYKYPKQSKDEKSLTVKGGTGKILKLPAKKIKKK